MYARSFATVTDTHFFRGAIALLNSIWTYYRADLRVYVFAYHLSSEQLDQLHAHPLGDALTVVENLQMTKELPVGMWEAKQIVFDYLITQCRTVCLLDSDLVLLDRLDDVFDLADSGRIVSSRDGTLPIVFGDNYRVYADHLVGQSAPFFNSGFLCLDVLKHWDLVALWSFSSRFGAYSPSGGVPLKLPGHGDQGILNALAFLLNKQDRIHLFDQDEWCNSGHWTPDRHVSIAETHGQRLVVVNNVTGRRQRLLHSTGPKWWTSEGETHFRQCGDIQQCFEHFDGDWSTLDFECDSISADAIAAANSQ